MRDIVAKLGEHIPRLRIGVGRPAQGEDLSNYVLNDFNPSEKELVLKSIDSVLENLDWLKTG